MLHKIRGIVITGLAGLLGAGVAITAAAAVTEISGAGATFPYPIYAKWAEAYSQSTGVKMNYQSIGSGGGIKQITEKTVDFGASDMPLKPEDLDKAGLMQFPTVVGGDVPVVNLKGVSPGQLKFSGAVLADIYLGKIKRWNDPKIAALNPGASLPDSGIIVVHRSDGSGTTFIWTNYLSKVSPEWKQTVGDGTSVAWPTGVGGKGNEGVASYVQHINGTIGYVEYAYVLQNKMTYALVQNREGVFVSPSSAAFQAAAAGADWQTAPAMYLILTDAPGKDSWPIAGATFILMHKQQAKPEVAKAVLDFFAWAYQNGDDMAAKLDYVPLPDNVVKLIEGNWQSIKGSNDSAVWAAAK
ncbi:MAG TPA: phosphate ABC transporter substrate-binding protein PstS [Gammaproteobacteria bacterium]|nr:phosphate ABC transporter substrate-binding protein PstS [Gammaproteobacteria bacterium]